MPVTEALRRLSEDPAFWAALRPGSRSTTDSGRPTGQVGTAGHRQGETAPQAGELRVAFPVAGGYGLVLDLDPGTGAQALGLRGPATSEPVQLAWAGPDHPHPAALRWWELELCARVIALDDPTLPHPGLVVALLSPFAPATPDDDSAAIAAVREAAYRSLRRDPAEDSPRRDPADNSLRRDPADGLARRDPTDGDPHVHLREQPPLPLFTDARWWPSPPAASPQVLDEATIAAWTVPPPALAEVRSSARFPHEDLTQLLRHATDRLARLRDEPGYAEAGPLARRITATGDLAGLPGLVGALTEAGCDHPTVLDALSEPLVPAEACWMVETLAGAEPGTLLRHHV